MLICEQKRTYCKEFSVFFLAEELGQLNSNNKKTKVTSSAPRENLLRLQALFYESPCSWAIWINNQKITSKNLSTSLFRVKQINARSVTLESTYKRTSYRITLRPNQSYDLNTKQVKEGASQ
jgi:hypothetical protein